MSSLVSDSNENLLRINISKFFTDLEQDIQKALFEYWNDDLKKGQVNLMLAPIHEKHQEYYEIIMHHKLNEFRRSQRIGTLLVFNERQKKLHSFKSEKPVEFAHSPNNLFGTLPEAEEKLANNTFTASEGTLSRVDSNINQIITEGYKSGEGINVVSRQITERFDQLRTWEATRIARTEIHGAQNEGIMSTYEDLGVEYTQWVAASDDRTRDSHLELDGEIIRMGDSYSNGLAFPGDTSGDIEEWINCRCSNAPFVMPAGMTAPEGMEQFRESDLVPIEQEQTQTETVEMELDQFALTPEEQARLDELRTADKLGLLGKVDLKNLEAKETFNYLHNKKIEGRISEAESIRYDNLYKKLVDKGLIEPISSMEAARQANMPKLFQDPNFFKLSEAETARREELMQKTKDKTITREEKKERRDLGQRERIQDLHEKLVKEGLDNTETRQYLDAYERLKLQGMELPEIPLELKFTTDQPTYERYSYTEVKIGDKYALNKKEALELYDLEKKQMLSEYTNIGNYKLTAEERARLKELDAQREFNHYYYVREGEGGLDYATEVKFKELFHKFEDKLKLDTDMLSQEHVLPKYEHNIKSDPNEKPLKLKGSFEDGMPPDHEILDLFTIDVTQATANEQRVVTRWMGNDFIYFRDFVVRSKGDIEAYIDYVMNASEEQLKHYGYIKNFVDEGNIKRVRKEITDIANSINHDLPVLDNILNNNMTKKAMTLWRKETRHHLGENPQPGDIVTFPGKNSTSITLEGAELFADVTNREMEWTYEIEAPAGTHGAYVSHLNQSERIRMEMEYLLADDTQMEIIEFDPDRNYAKLNVLVE